MVGKSDAINDSVGFHRHFPTLTAAPSVPPLYGYGMHGSLWPGRGDGFADLLRNNGLPIPKWERVRFTGSPLREIGDGAVQFGGPADVGAGRMAI